MITKRRAIPPIVDASYDPAPAPPSIGVIAPLRTRQRDAEAGSRSDPRGR